jgi:CheY-like chemotaxis protein
MKIFVLEDNSYRINFFIERFSDCEVIVTENAKSAVEYLQEDIFNYVFLDHDLGENDGCGLDVVEYLANNPQNVNNMSVIIIHSWNIPATEKMITILPKAIHIPFDVNLFSEMAF